MDSIEEQHAEEQRRKFSPPNYIEEIESIADSFRYENCEVCGGDLARHTIAPGSRSRRQ